MTAYGMATDLPPSIARVWPVMKEAAGEARNTMVAATSCAVPGRPSGCSSYGRQIHSGLHCQYCSMCGPTLAWAR